MNTTSPVTVDVYYQALPQAAGSHQNVVGQASTTASHSDQQSSASRRHQLPQTGNHNSQTAFGLGLSVLLGMIGLLGSQHRKDE